MAELGRMTVTELVSRVLADEPGDALKEAVAYLADALMEAEVEGLTGVGYRERSPERKTCLNGYRGRSWHTRVGEIELAIPKLRQGTYFPTFLEPRRRSEQALVACVQEAYVNGVSTRKIDSEKVRAQLILRPNATPGKRAIVRLPLLVLIVAAACGLAFALA